MSGASEKPPVDESRHCAAYDIADCPTCGLPFTTTATAQQVVPGGVIHVATVTTTLCTCGIRRTRPRPPIKPASPFARRCAACGSDFLALAASGERGIWRNWHWFCSIECDEVIP